MRSPNYPQKHNYKITGLFNKKELIGFLITFILFGSLGVYGMIYDVVMGVIIILIALVPPLFLFKMRADKEFIQVIKITDTDDVTRINHEYWRIEDVRELDRNFFWKKKNNLIVVGQVRDNKLIPVNPFNKPIPPVTSGHIKRSSIQSATDDLMVPEKGTLKEAVVLGGIFLLAAGLVLMDYLMFNRMLEAGRF